MPVGAHREAAFSVAGGAAALLIVSAVAPGLGVPTQYTVMLATLITAAASVGISIPAALSVGGIGWLFLTGFVFNQYGELRIHGLSDWLRLALLLGVPALVAFATNVRAPSPHPRPPLMFNREDPALADLDRVRIGLLAAVSHDLRTPLTGVKAAVSSLRQADVEWSADDREALLATIEESADRLAEQIANLIDMSRLQAGAVTVDLRPVALDEVVAKALIGSGDDRVEMSVPDDLPLVLADPGLLERAVANLVDNACRFSPASTVRVEADQPDQHDVVRLRIIDHGSGAAAADHERIFAPFQRLGDRSEGGVGLGLAIARGFTQVMGGSLTPSETFGGGLTMTMTLKVAS